MPATVPDAKPYVRPKGKIANFAYSPWQSDKFIEYAKADVEATTRLLEQWKNNWPEVGIWARSQS